MRICIECKNEIKDRPYPAVRCWKCAKERTERLEKERYEREKGRRDDECLFCKSNDGLHKHHLDFNRENNDRKNIAVLCGSCHSKVHSKILKVFIKNMVEKLTKEKSITETAEIIGITKQRVSQILKEL